MKIAYRHVSAPREIRIYDTEKSKRRNPFILSLQEEFDKQELLAMERDRIIGTILSYEVVNEEVACYA